MIRPQLLLFLVRPMTLTTGCALGIAGLFLLLYRDPILETNIFAFLFVLFHAAAVAYVIRPTQSHCRYGYGRAYSRDTIWGHQFLAAAVAVLAVWLVATLLLATPMRGTVQEALFRSPYYPLLRPREAWVPLHWLYWYAVLIPLFHYASIREFFPAKSGASGFALAVGAVLALLVFFLNGTSQWFRAHDLPDVGKIVFAIAALISLAAGRGLHRGMEVRS